MSRVVVCELGRRKSDRRGEYLRRDRSIVEVEPGLRACEQPIEKHDVGGIDLRPRSGGRGSEGEWARGAEGGDGAENARARDSRQLRSDKIGAACRPMARAGTRRPRGMVFDDQCCPPCGGLDPFT